MLGRVAGWARQLLDDLDRAWAGCWLGSRLGGGGLLVGLGLSLVSSRRSCFSGQFFLVTTHFRQKWTHGAGRRRTPKISRPAGQDFGPADMGGGGWGGGKILVGGCGREDGAGLPRGGAHGVSGHGADGLGLHEDQPLAPWHGKSGEGARTGDAERGGGLFLVFHPGCFFWKPFFGRGCLSFDS